MWRESAALPAPDPLFSEGHRAALAATATDPAVPGRMAAAQGLAESYARIVEQLHLELAGLPEPLTVAPESAPFTASVTGMVTLAGCPLRFRWAELERLPRHPTPAARRGVELHRRIELHNRGAAAFEEADTGFYDAVGEEPAPGNAFERYQRSRFAAVRPILVEVPFTLVITDARISGRIDAVYEDEVGWEVVDFKSGRASEDPARRVQLEAYALAVAEAGLAGGRSPGTIRVTFAYCGGAEVEEVTETVDAAWLEQAREHLATLVSAAVAAEHPPRPSPSCRRCDFLHMCPAGTAWMAANG